MASNHELLYAWRRGDSAAGDELIRRHFHQLYRYFRTKVGVDADELTQRTLLACVQSVDRIQTSFRAYAFGVARRMLIRHIGARPRTVASDGADELPFDGPSPSEGANDSEERRLLYRALRRLSLEQQTSLEMFYWEDLSVAEIAEVLDCPAGTVKARLSRARVRLRDVLETIPADESTRRATRTTLTAWAQKVRDARDS